MISNTTLKYNNISVSLRSEKDLAQVFVQGAEVYQLTHKGTGAVSLIAFDTRYAANRFFAEDKEHFHSKIF